MSPRQAVHDQYSDSLSIKLTEWITISAAVMALFTFTMPHLHHLRVWSAIAVALIFVFTFIAVGIAIKDGASPCQAFIGTYSHLHQPDVSGIEITHSLRFALSLPGPMLSAMT